MVSDSGMKNERKRREFLYMLTRVYFRADDGEKEEEEEEGRRRNIKHEGSSRG